MPPAARLFPAGPVVPMSCSVMRPRALPDVRLYANMFAGEMVTLVFFSLYPLAVRRGSTDCTCSCR